MPHETVDKLTKLEFFAASAPIDTTAAHKSLMRRSWKAEGAEMEQIIDEVVRLRYVYAEKMIAKRREIDGPE